MGIPSYFKHVIRKYRHIITECNHHTIDNLYIDAQSIIYDAVRTVSSLEQSKINNMDNAIIEEVVKKIGYYIDIISPNKKVYIAFDGVAPVAKLNQQRSRRYKGQIEKQIYKQLGLNQRDTWNTVVLTPGTVFMSQLGKHIHSAFKNPRKYGVKEILISTSEQAGEGEHKLYEYIRNNQDYHKSSITAIYGLDADLIMLSLNHLEFSKNIFLFRETPHFIKSIDSTLKPGKNYILDMSKMSEAITNDLNEGRNIKDESQKQRMHDYIFICFLLGNDFLPHFPALNIRTDGITRITAAYKETLSKCGNLTNKSGIIWKHFKTFITILSDNEEEYIKSEDVIREKQAKSVANGRPGDNHLENAVMNIPIQDRCKEIYINPNEDGWRERYYVSLFDSRRCDELCKQVSMNYLEGLEWTYKYYTIGCSDWLWYYKFNYPPLLCDLKRFIPNEEYVFVIENTTQPVHPHLQLAYVLPPNCIDLLPENIRNIIIKDLPEWLDNDKRVTIEYAYCRYLWESHIHINGMDINTLASILCL